MTVDDVAVAGRSSAARTSAVTMPPEPGASARSSTTTRRRAASASRTASAGNGRNVVMPSTPIFSPPARSSSTASLSVPSTEPSATTTISASSVR